MRKSLEQQIEDKNNQRIGMAIKRMNYFQRLWWALTGRSVYMTRAFWEGQE